MSIGTEIELIKELRKLNETLKEIKKEVSK